MDLLLTLLIFILIFGLIYWVTTLIPLPGPMRQIVIVILAVIAIIYLLGMLFGGFPHPIVLRR